MKWLWIAASVCWIAGLSVITSKVHDEPVAPANIVTQKNNFNSMKNIKIYHNVTYGKVSHSQMDILMPKKIKKGDKLPLILWTHGGGYIGGDKKYKNAYLAQLAERGFIVANMNYALAPQYKYPVPIKQQVTASRYLKHNSLKLPIDFSQVIIGGDSAGAQLASQFAAIQTNEQLRNQMGLPQSFKPEELKAVILFGGLYNMDTVRKTHFPRIQLFMESYTGERKWEQSFAAIDQLSTTKQVTPNYPPIFLTVGDADPFVSQAHELMAVLKDNKVPYRTSLFDKTHHLRHQYQFHMDLKESQQTFNQLVSFLSTYTKQNPYHPVSTSK